MPVAMILLVRRAALRAGLHTHALPVDLFLLERHELAHEPDVPADALAPLEHERVRARERPVVRVDQVRHHRRH
ncbi:hypothetical protein C8J57DRAFT_1389860 [Mycena rebaudengoi]|nr:hypothetical protein C8J57DRAFT_1389860 [Mycena rebaudengoi]